MSYIINQTEIKVLINMQFIFQKQFPFDYRFVELFRTFQIVNR